MELRQSSDGRQQMLFLKNKTKNLEVIGEKKTHEHDGG